ncbi:MAG: PH domain-containing protein [Chloroflexi bacterium]|nr:PH domain-containing protein [Chloroflexota bacterium]
MSIGESRARMVAVVWGAVARSGVSLDALPREQQDRLVTTIAEGVLVAIDAQMSDVERAIATEREPIATGGDEEVLWEGRSFLSLTQHYTVTTERVRVRRGFLGRATDNVELSRLQDVDVAQHAGERMANIGDITLYGANKSDPVVVLENVHNPEQVQETIRKAMLAARRRYGVRIREDLEQ